MTVTNGDFETGDLTGWTSADPEIGGSATKSTVVDSSIKHSGSYSCKMTSTSYSSPDVAGCIRYQNITLIVGAVIHDWVYIPTYSGNAVAKVQLYGDSGEIDVAVFTGTTGWIDYDYIVNTEDVATIGNNPKIRFLVNTADTGNIIAYFDDFSDGSELPPVASFTQNTTARYPGGSIHFTDTSTGDPTSWSWDFDDGSEPGTGSNPTHVFTAVGVYHVVLTATNAGGSDVSDPTTITIVDLPDASFTMVKTGLSVEFTDTSTGDPTSWEWDFGDGETSTEQNPTHVYDQAWGNRSYDVVLTVANAAGEDVADVSDPEEVDIDPPEITVVITGTVGASIVSLYPDPLSMDVDWDISKRYWLATVVIGGNYALPASTDHPTITITVPDHEMANQTIFYGFVASASHTQKFSEDTTTLICYSFDWYLSNQNVPIRSTIASWSSGGGPVYATPDEVIKRFLGTSIAADNWAYTTGINPYNIDTNAAWGDPLTWYALLNGAIDADDTSAAFDNAEGTLSGTSNLWIGTEMMTTSSTTTPLTVDRAEGGTTGIAHADNSVIIKLNASITAPQKGFVWTPTTKKIIAIQELSEYTDFMLYCYWKSLTGEWTPVAYWIAADDIDTDMDLPAQVTIPITDPNLIDAIQADEKNEEIVNRVIIWGAIDPITNLRYYKMVETAEVTAHTVKPKEYTECEDRYNSQSAVNDRADLVLEQMSLDAITHSMPLNKRNDLRPYQLITVTDSDNVLEVDMRIIGIRYVITNLSDMQVFINFISDRKFTAARKLKRVAASSQWSEINELIADWYSRILLADMVDISEFEIGSGVAKNTYGDYVPVTGPNS